MATPILKAEVREVTGKNKVTKERKRGFLPAVVYSRGKDTQSLYLNSKELDKIIARHGTSTRVALDLNGEKTFVIIKEVQRSSVKNELLHIDLQTLDENEKIKMAIPIHIMNKDKVETNTEILQIQLNEVEIQTYPRYLPERIEVDALKLKEQDSLTFADLNIASDNNIEILGDMTSVIATVVYATKEEEPEEGTEDLLDI